MEKIKVEINAGLNAKVDEIVAAKQDDIVNTLCEFLRIPSVKAEPAPGAAPFGKPVREALDYALKLAEQMGFATTDMDGYVGTADYGEGEEMLGIMCHVDVVPEGIGWEHPPYAAEIADGKIFARGALDDKGPTICALYALAAIKEAGLKTKRRIRVILGCDEESGWGCMEHYAKHGETPHIAFSPDADYPLVNSEKGILHAAFKREFQSNLRLESGSRPNVVPNSAKITLPAADFELDTLLTAAENAMANGFEVDASLEGDEIMLEITGQGAHAATPEMGKNALLAALDTLARLELAETDAQIVKVLHDALAMDMHAEHLGLDREDDSGRTTINAGVMHWDEDGIHEFALDMRCPRTLVLEDAMAKLKETFGAVELEYFDGELKKGLYVPRDSELVSKLLDVYTRRTGEKADPLAIGGGTYARAFENAVAFGCERPGHPAPIHMANEFITLEDVMFNTYMIADAIIALACE